MAKGKKFSIYDIYTKDRPLSWTAISSFEYDPEQWLAKYVLKAEPTTSPEMIFGSETGRQLAESPSFLPEVPRLPIFEYELRAKFGKVWLIGFIDSYGPPKDVPKFGAPGTVRTFAELYEYKTGKKAWTQQRADEHGQIDMYLLMLNIMHKLKPEEVSCTVFWLPTQENGDFTISFVPGRGVQSFRTQRSMRDILLFGARINKTLTLMQKYATARLGGKEPETAAKAAGVVLPARW